MSMPRSIVRRDGQNRLNGPEHAPLVLPEVPRRASRSTFVPRETQESDVLEIEEEEDTQDRFDYSAQNIITLPHKAEKQRGTRPAPTRTLSQPESHGRQVHWLVPVGVSMLLILASYLFCFMLYSGARTIYDNWTYGATRTYQVEAVVGDHDSSTHPTHFVALNLHGTIDVIEIPGGDVTHAKMYPGPHLLWSNADKAVTTLEIKDINGDQKPDVVVHIQGDLNLLFQPTSATFVLLNNGSGFNSMQQMS